MPETGGLFWFPFLIYAFPLFFISVSFAHSHRRGCSHSVLPSERANLWWQFHPQQRLGPWKCPHLLLSLGPLSISDISAVLEPWTVADPEIHPADKGGLQT